MFGLSSLWKRMSKPIGTCLPNGFRLDLVLFFFCFIVFFVGVGGHLYSGDEVVNYLLTESIFLRLRLDISPDLPYAKSFDVDFNQLPRTLFAGKFYSWYGLLQPAVAIPLYTAANTIGFDPWILTEILFYPTVTALTCVLICKCGRKLGYSERVSAALAFVYGFASFAWPYSKFFNDFPLATLMILASVSNAIDGREQATRRMMSGLFGGLAFLTRRETALLIPAFLIYYRLRKEKVNHIVAYVAPLFVGGAVYGYYNYVRFGSAFDFGLGYHQTLAAYRLPLLGMLGLLTSPGVGLVFYFPLLILTLALFPRFYRKHRKEAVLFALIFAIELVFYGSYENWHGWGYWGPRYLLISLPFLVLPLGEGLAASRDSLRWKYAIATLAFLGGLVNLLGVLIYFQVGFAVVWSKLGSDWWEYALWRFEYCPIAVHLGILMGLLSPVQFDIGIGEISPGKFDLFWLSRVGLFPVTLMLLSSMVLPAYVFLSNGPKGEGER